MSSQYVELIVGIAWPVAILAVVGVVLFMFRDPLRKLLEKTGSVKVLFPGGSGVELQQSTKPVVDAGDSISSDLADHIWRLGAEREALSGELEKFAVGAVFWQFSFFTLFLAPHTKAVLEWVGDSTQPIGLRRFHQDWSVRIPDPAERKRVLLALLDQGLLTESEQGLKADVVGKAYLKYLRTGNLPYRDYNPYAEFVANH